MAKVPAYAGRRRIVEVDVHDNHRRPISLHRPTSRISSTAC
jgi:hypothetical protein